MKNKNHSDWAVALTVIVCSAVLLVALLFALSGKALGRPARTICANFHDVTGISLNAAVKYAGATAGKISGIRMLSPAERLATGDPLNAVQVSLALNKNVPALPSDIEVSVAADTLLSDKFILLDGGSPAAPALADGAVVQGVTPTNFDKLARDVDGAIEGLRGMLHGTQGETGDIFERLRTLLRDTQALVSEARPVVEDAKALASDARQLIADNKESITRAVVRLDKAATAIEQLAARGDSLFVNNERKITFTLSDFRVTAENLKVTSTYAKFLIRSLAQRPSQLLWGNSRPPLLPSEQEILQARKPIETD